ncbi:MAG: aspartate aminotransferase family protein [Rhizomicrobium sp.]
MAMINAYAGKGAVAAEDRRLIARREAVLGPAYRLFYETPVHFVRGEGVWLYDSNGDAYLDAYNNVVSVGHCRPEVVEAIARQSAVLNTHTRYLHDGIVAYSERLLAKFPSELSHVMYTCTGSEANDLALRIAKNVTGGTGFVVTELAYHGGTDLIAGLSPSLGPAVDLGEHVRTVPAPDTLKVPAGKLGSYFADGVRAAIADLKRHGIKPAALLVDTIFSSDGVYSDPPDFLREAVAAARDAGLLFVADEVQPGFGRTGDAMWGFLRHDVAPDIVTLGKPMGNGYPIAGLAIRPEVVEAFGRSSRYFNTFGGSPVACAAGMAVLDVLEKERLQENAREVGAYLRSQVKGLSSSFVADVRGAGLFIGVEIAANDKSRTDGEITARIVNGLRERRVLISATGPKANVLKIRPPLVFSKNNADQLVDALRAVLNSL